MVGIDATDVHSVRIAHAFQLPAGARAAHPAQTMDVQRIGFAGRYLGNAVERGKRHVVTEDKVLTTLLERQMTETWFRATVQESDYRRSSEVVNHGELIVDFVASGEILGGGKGKDTEKLPQWITDEEEKTAARFAA